MGPPKPSSLTLCKMEARGPDLFLPQTYNNLFGNTDFSSESSGIDLWFLKSPEIERYGEPLFLPKSGP